MLKKLKRFFKISFYLFLILLIGGGTFAHLNKDKIIAAFTAKANTLLNTRVAYQEIDFSIIEQFPEMVVQLENPVIFDAIEGSKDTFMLAENIYFSMDLLKLIRGEYNVNKIGLEQASITIKIDKEGNNNYTIFKSDTSTADTNFQFNLENIYFNNVGIHYIDQRINNNHLIHTKELNAEIAVSEKQLKIALNGELFSDYLSIRGERYLEEKPVSINGELDFNVKSKKLSIHPSSIIIEGSEFALQGSYINNSQNTTNVDIEGKNTGIQTIISLLPNTASSKLKEYQSAGSVYFKGKINGNINNEESPAIRFDFGFKNASFFHPATKQKITNASLTGFYSNGNNRKLSSSEVSLKNVVGNIGNDTFQGNFLYKNFNNPYLKMDIDADIDVKKLLEVYPIEEITSPKGRFSIHANFDGLIKDMKRDTRKVKSNGSFQLKNISFNWGTKKLQYTGLNGNFLFNNNDLGITEFNGKAGESDFSLNGFFKNFVSYLFIDNVTLKMEAGLSSNFLDLDELLSTNHSTNVNTTTNTQTYQFNVAKNLAFDLDCHIKSIKFRNLSKQNIGKNLKVDLHLKNQQIQFNQLSFDLAGGSIQTSGYIDARDTKNYKGHFKGQVLSMKVDRLFFVLEDFSQDFLTHKNISGDISGSFDSKLFINNELQFKGSQALADLDITINNGALKNLAPLEEMGLFLRLNKYDKYLRNSNLSSVKFSELKNKIHIENNTIFLPEMDIKSTSADFLIRGEHTFKNEIDYYVSFPLINYKKREERKEDGIRQNKNTGEFYVYMQLLGTVDKFDIILDKKHTVDTAKEKISNEIKHIIKADPDEVIYIDEELIDTTNVFDEDEF